MNKYPVRKKWLTHFFLKFPFDPLKTSENQRLFDIFRGSKGSIGKKGVKIN